jgi:hypothetical protein
MPCVQVDVTEEGAVCTEGDLTCIRINDIPTLHECQNGEWKSLGTNQICEGYDLYYCDGDEVRVKQNAEECGFVGECTSGEVYCDETNLMVCENGQWLNYGVVGKCIGSDKYSCSTGNLVVTANHPDCVDWQKYLPYAAAAVGLVALVSLIKK